MPALVATRVLLHKVNLRRLRAPRYASVRRTRVVTSRKADGAAPRPASRRALPCKKASNGSLQSLVWRSYAKRGPRRIKWAKNQALLRVETKAFTAPRSQEQPWLRTDGATTSLMQSEGSRRAVAAKPSPRIATSGRASARRAVAAASRRDLTVAVTGAAATSARTSPKNC